MTQGITHEQALKKLDELTNIYNNEIMRSNKTFFSDFRNMVFGLMAKLEIDCFARDTEHQKIDYFFYHYEDITTERLEESDIKLLLEKLENWHALSNEIIIESERVCVCTHTGEYRRITITDGDKKNRKYLIQHIPISNKSIIYLATGDADNSDFDNKDLQRIAEIEHIEDCIGSGNEYADDSCQAVIKTHYEAMRRIAAYVPRY